MVKDKRQVSAAFRNLEERRTQVIEDLRHKLDQPFQKAVQKKHVPQTIKNDPIRKIIKTNEKIHKSNQLMNQKLL